MIIPRDEDRRKQSAWTVGAASGRVLRDAKGFTLLEVLVALTILALGASIMLSLISDSLGNIRKVQSRIRIVEHANSVMELTLLDESIQGPRTFTGDFEDGTRWTVQVEEYTPPPLTEAQSQDTTQNMPAKLLKYSVDMFQPRSNASDYRLQTLKLIKISEENQPVRSAP